MIERHSPGSVTVHLEGTTVFSDQEYSLADSNLIFSEDLRCIAKLSHGYDEKPINRVTFLPVGTETPFLDVVELSFRDERVPNQLEVNRRYRMELHIIPIDGDEEEE